MVDGSADLLGLGELTDTDRVLLISSNYVS